MAMVQQRYLKAKSVLPAGIACVVIALMFACTVPSIGHELRPIITTVQVGSDGRLQVQLSLDLEAAITGIDPAHGKAAGSEQTIEYRRLRRLPPDALKLEFERQSAKVLSKVQLTDNGNLVRLTVGDVKILPTGEASVQRFSTLTLQGKLGRRPNKLHWRLSPDLGDSIVRIQDPVSQAIVDTDIVAAGKPSKALDLGTQ